VQKPSFRTRLSGLLGATKGVVVNVTTDLFY
jgi:hypothetical protein